MTKKTILAWADAHRRRRGQWPTKRSGPVFEDPRTTWLGVDTALYKGGRGLSGGTTLQRFLHWHGRSAPRVKDGNKQ